MGIGALIGGAAAGLQGGWDDNREAFKEEAKRNFQMMLEEKRNTNVMAAESRARTDRDDQRIINKNDADQANIDMLDPTTPSGSVYAANAKAARAKEDREYANDQEDRQAKIDAAAARSGGKAGKLPAEVQLAFDMSEQLRGKSEAGPLSDQEAKDLASYDSIVKKHAGVMPPPPPTPTEGATSKLTSGKGTEKEFKGYEKAFNLPPGTAKELYNKANPKPTVTTTPDRETFNQKNPDTNSFQARASAAVSGLIGGAKDTIASHQSNVVKGQNKAVTEAINRLQIAAESGTVKPLGQDISLITQLHDDKNTSDADRKILSELLLKFRKQQ